jgi:UDP-glucuronate 4-epimerase
VKVLVTGAAGFIGMHVAERLLAAGHQVTGLDNLNDYYDPALKQARLARLRDLPGFVFERLDLADGAGMRALFAAGGFERVVHLGAQAGVRYSLTNPQVYLDSNVTGTLNLLEGCRHHGVGHLVFASTSSVYGLNTRMPFSPHHGTDHPISIYASTKKAGELLCHNYAALFGLPVTALRFFTVYGPWGRPDMSPMLFAQKMLAGQPIDVFNGGHHRRDFTYIDDIVEGVVRAMERVATPDPAWDSAAPDPATSRVPYRIYNIGNQSPVELLRFIGLLEEHLGVKAQMNFLPLQPGDVPDTLADCSDLEREVGYRPSTPIEEGVRRFVAWYREYYPIIAG